MTPVSPLWYWTVVSLAGVLALGGVIVLWLALFRDRSRGRKRCPKCWYDMAGTAGLTCPECGKHVRDAKQLVKTRRRWGRAAIGALMVVIAVAGVVGELFVRRGWRESTPTWALIAAMPWTGGPARMELLSRYGNLRMRAWESRWMASRVFALLDAPPDPGAPRDDLMAIARDLFDMAEYWEDELPYAPSVRLCDLETPGRVHVLVRLLDDPDPQMMQKVLQCLRHCRSSTPIITAGILHRLGAPGWEQATIVEWYMEQVGERGASSPRELWPELWGETGRRPGADGLTLYQKLHACNEDIECMKRVFLDGLPNMMCIWGLWRLAPNDPEVQDRILALAEEREPWMRAAVIRFAAHVPLTDRAAAIILRGMLENEREVRFVSLRAAGQFGADGRVFLDELRRAMDDPDPDIAELAMRSWAKCGGDRTTATRVLLSRIDPKDYRTGWALKCLGEVGEASPEVAALITPLLQDRDHRAAAAEAAMHLGIEPATATRVLLERATRPRPHGDDYDHQAMELLKKAARAGLLHMETLRAGLDDPNAAMRGTALTAMGCSGARAGPYLARIRELYADPRFEPRSIDHVIKQIEWAIEHPEGAK